MARQRDSKLVGTIQNIVFYNLRGEYYMRSKPTVVRRASTSVHSGLNFGKASKICKQIRKLVDPINPVRSDLRLMFKLTGILNKFIAWKEKVEARSNKMPTKLPFINGFQFNDQADLSNIRAIQPNVNSTSSGLTEITFSSFIPVQSFSAPANTFSVSIKVYLLTANLNDSGTRLLGSSEIEVPFTSESFQPHAIIILGSANPGDLLLMVMAVQYMVNKNDEIQIATDLKKMPCGVAWAGFA